MAFIPIVVVNGKGLSQGKTFTTLPTREEGGAILFGNSELIARIAWHGSEIHAQVDSPNGDYDKFFRKIQELQKWLNESKMNYLGVD